MLPIKYYFLGVCYLIEDGRGGHQGGYGSEGQLYW